MDQTDNTVKITVAAAALVVGIVAGYLYGNQAGYKKGDEAGYKRAEEAVKKLQEAAGNKATQEAAKAANPFQSSNPLKGVEANPFDKAKKVLNPFE